MPQASKSSMLRRFVAYSILAHIGAGLSWGLPSLIVRMNDEALAQEEKTQAEHFRKESIKAKEHVRQQRIEQTRREVDKELRKEFDKLTANISEPRRDKMWEDVAEKMTPQAENFADALNNPDTPEQDLRTLEAQLRQAMIESLNQELNDDTAQALADNFVDQVESEMTPELAKWMQDELNNRVTQKMREEAERLINKQREEAQRARDQTLGALREAQAKVDAANAAATQAGDQLALAQASSKRADEQASKGDAASKQAADKSRAESGSQNSAAAKQMGQAKDRLGEADGKIGNAAPKAANLDGTAQSELAAADKAIDAARDAAAKAASAVETKSADAADAVAAAKAATAAAQAATKSAIDAVNSQGDRAAAAAAAIQAAAQDALSDQVGEAIAAEMTGTTIPRLAGKLQDAFKKQLEQNGMGSDDALAAQVGKEIQERLGKAVAEMAKAGEKSVEGQLGAVGGKLGDSAKGAGAAQHGGGAEGEAQPSNALDKALADAIAGIGASAAKRVGEIAANASQDGRMIGKATGSGSEGGGGDAAAMAQLRDSVGALARSMGSGRVGAGSSGGLSIGSLRQGALARGGMSSGMPSAGGPRPSDKHYQEVTGQIAGREAVQGARWTRQGAEGEASRAADVEGDVPAKVVGEPADASKPSLTNDAPYNPTFKSIAFTIVPYFNGEFRIDGNLGKWDAMPAIVLKPEHGTDPSQQVMKLAWSNAGLFFYLKIVDPNHKIDKAEAGNFWQADVAEVWIDAYNTKESYRARHIGQQFWLWPFGSASDPTATGGESVIAVKGGGYVPTALHADKLERWATETPDGWVMEARLPPALITDADMAAGRIIGFNTYITTMGGTDWYWSAGKDARTYAQPDTWGDLLLAGSDARIEVLSGRESETKRVLTVGEPLRLRVTDGDMDLNPTVRDKVMVSLKNGRGGQQMAVLEETGESTSVFEGAVSTALSLDEAPPAVLGVYEGERIDIVYVDQARANGAREAQVAATVSFGSAVMAMGAPAKLGTP